MKILHFLVLIIAVGFVNWPSPSLGGLLDIRIGAQNPYTIPNSDHKFQDVVIYSGPAAEFTQLDSRWSNTRRPDWYSDVHMMKTKGSALVITARFVAVDEGLLQEFARDFKKEIQVEPKGETLFLNSTHDQKVACKASMRSNGIYFNLSGVCMDSLFIQLPKGMGLKKLKVWIEKNKVPAPTFTRKVLGL